jgi:hypothetical protein
MTTAVVVTTIVTDKGSEASLKEQIFEQIRKNEKDLRAKVHHLDVEARVHSAVFNLADFLNYAQTWAQPREEAPDPATTNGHSVTSNHQAELSEAYLMDQALEEIRQGQQPILAALTVEELAALEDEKIGEEFSSRPFLY